MGHPRPSPNPKPKPHPEQVNWDYVRVLPDGECVSVDGTHLGHNLPDRSGNRYCINLVSVPPHAPRTSPLAVPPLGSAPSLAVTPLGTARGSERGSAPEEARGPSQRIDPPGGEADPQGQRATASAARGSSQPPYKLTVACEL